MALTRPSHPRIPRWLGRLARAGVVPEARRHRRPAATPVAQLWFVPFLCVLFALRVSRADSPTPVAATPATQPLESITPCYRAEFGPDLTPADLTRLYAAHTLIESYFAGHRDESLKQLNQLPITPLEVARLCRIRLTWPDLPPGLHHFTPTETLPHADFFVFVPETYRRETPTPTLLLLGAGHEDAFLREQAAKYPGFLLIAPTFKPLAQGNGLWGPGREGMNPAIAALQQAADLVAIDPRRVYLRGMENTGPAAFDLASHYPTYFAAVSAKSSLAYDWQRVRLGNLHNQTLVVAQDDQPRTRDFVSALKSQKIPVLRAEKNWTSVSRTLDPALVILRTTRPDIPFCRNDWIQAWQPISPGQEETRIVPGAGSGIRLFQYPISIQAACANNHITLETKNTAALRLLLSPDMVDFSQPITVELNHKVVHQALVPQGHQATLQDQLLLGRGWRQYTASLDLEPPPLTPTSAKPTTTHTP